MRLELDGIHKRFGEQEVLRGVSLTADPGQVCFVIGESGAGKSVLIKQIVGLLTPDRGSIRLGGNEVVGLSERALLEVRKSCQLIFQHATLFEALTVLENVAMPIAKRFRVPWREAEGRARTALERVHAEHLGPRLPSELGAGVNKRVAIARALALEPKVMLYDEPTTSLDPVAARRMDRLIAEMARRFGLTSVVVSHDLTSVRLIGDHVTFLHEGQVRFAGPPAALFASHDPVVRRFVDAARR